MKKYLIINGPNLNMLGIREPEIYGSKTYDDLCGFIKAEADKMGVEVEFFQSNSEGDIVTRIHQTHGSCDGIVINPGAYSHYSYAIHDALTSVSTRAVEVHISDISKREDFRRRSVTAPACIAMISGEGFEGYIHALSRLENDEG